MQEDLFNSVVYSEIHVCILYSYLPVESWIYLCKIKTLSNFFSCKIHKMKNYSLKYVSLPLLFLSLPIFICLSIPRCKTSYLFTSHVDHYWEFDFQKECAQKERLISRKSDSLRNAGMARRVWKTEKALATAEAVASH